MVEAVQEKIRLLGFGELVDQEQLHGGLTSHVLRLKFSTGKSLVFKESERAQPEMYVCEADGLATIGRAGALRVPEVFSVGEDHLLLEDLGVGLEPTTERWIAFGRALAQQHNVTSSQFGYPMANYLGTMRLDNTWNANGHEYFAETRMLRFIREPKSGETFTAEELRGVERLAAKLPDIIPVQPASLLHGDLWDANLLFSFDDRPAVIDPAVNYGWAEADLGLLLMTPEIPRDFYDAYLEVHPLEAGWEDRADLLSIRDRLCMISEYGDIYDSVAFVNRLIAKYV